MIDLHNTTAVITGGGRGLGRVFAQALAASGAQVAVIARSQRELDETVSSIGLTARAFCADVTDAAAIAAVLREIGTVDVLVNNAGVLGPIGPFAETDFEDWWRTMDVNVRGAMLCTRHLLPGMMERRRGRIINIVTGAFSPAYLSPYLASKTAIVRATECLAAETRSSGIALFSVAPGTILTEMSSRSLHSPEGQKWIPWFKDIFDRGLNLPPERPAALIAELASGKYDALSGLFLSPFDDLDALLAERAQVEKEKLNVLQIRPHKLNAAGLAVAAIRDGAVKR